MSKKNAPDPNKVLRWELYKASPLISQKYPNVKSLIIEQTFHDDSGTEQIAQTRWNVPIDTTRAYFYIDCRMRECIDGGFDLTQAVISTIENGETRSSGRLVCQGWQDKERAGQFHCLTDLVYQIEVNYQ